MEDKGSLKRKSDELVSSSTDREVKIQKSLQANNNSNGENTEKPKIGIDLDGTQSYDIEDSDGFEFQTEEELNADTQDFIQNDSENDAPTTLQTESTEENSQPLELIIQNGNNESEKIETDAVDSGSANTGSCSMKRFESVQKDAELISNVIPSFDVNTIYNKVLEKRSENKRVDIVTNELIEKSISGEDIGESRSFLSGSSSDGIFKEVADVLIKCPNADANRVYDMLEKLEGNQDRVGKVLSQLSNISSSKDSSKTSLDASSDSVTSSNKSTDLFSDPAFKSNPLYYDLKTLRKVLPNTDPNELYAFLEAHFDKPNRVQVVIDELTKSDSQESLPPAVESLEVLEKGKAPLTAEDKLQSDLHELKQVFTDCDPNYLYEKLDKLSNDPERVGTVATSLFENKNYPKLKETLDKEKKEQLKSKITKMDFNLTDFLRKFPNPVVYFGDIERQVNQNYKAHVTAYLKNTYPYLKEGYIKKVVENHKHHLAPSVTEVEEELEDIMARNSKKKRATPRDNLLEYPDDPEELFFQEIMYCQHQQQIKEHLQEQRVLRDIKITDARETGELHECGCCFDDECLFEEMEACADGHIFCKECILRSCEAAVGEGKVKFMCLTGECEQQFPLRVLQDVLPASIFSLALRKMQEEELRQADIPDLVTCPFCSFATIMPDQEDKVLKCLSAECLRESCRLCQEPNHVPLRCDEVEKQGETNMRAFIETKMSEAMLRECPSCKKRFYKVDGCNKMTCTCGTSMCYVCRAANIDYNHFEGGECKIDSDIMTLHKDEMLEAAEKARQEYLDNHPEANTELKYDPVKLLEKMKNRWDGNDGGDDNIDEYDNDDEEDYDE